MSFIVSRNMKVFFQIMKSPRGVLPIMAFTGRLRPNGELFQASGIIDDRGGISLVEVYESVGKTVISVCIQKGPKVLGDAFYGCENRAK